MSKPETLIDIILAAVRDGYDVTISVHKRADGTPGDLHLPSEWVDRLGIAYDIRTRRALITEQPRK